MSHHIKTTPLRRSIANAERTKWPTRGLQQSPERLQAANYEPSNKKAQLDYHAPNANHSMIIFDDENNPSSPVPSP